MTFKNKMVDEVARALIDADPTMFGYHETHIEAKRDSARAAIAAVFAALDRKFGRASNERLPTSKK